MKDHLNTPTVLFTGALTGIGRATAFAFAQEGARVVVSGRHNDDYSTMRVKVAGGPTMNTLAESKIESVGEGGAELTLVGEDSGTATLRLPRLGRP